MSRKSLILHFDSLEILDEISDEQAGKLFKAIKSFNLNEHLELDQITKLIFSPFKSQFLRDMEKYQKTCEKRALAGSKGGKQRVANQANASTCNQNQANQADSKSKNKSDSKSNNIKTLDQQADRFCVNKAFDYFWSDWKNKVGKVAAKKSFTKLMKGKSRDEAKQLIANMLDYQDMALGRLANGDKRFIGFDAKHAASYINQRQWEDLTTEEIEDLMP